MGDGRRHRGSLRRSPVATRAARLYLYLPPEMTGMFRFLLEAHDNLALFTVLDPRRAAIRLSFPPDREADVRAALARIAAEVPLTVVEPRLAPCADAPST